MQSARTASDTASFFVDPNHGHRSRGRLFLHVIIVVEAKRHYIVVLRPRSWRRSKVRPGGGVVDELRPYEILVAALLRDVSYFIIGEAVYDQLRELSFIDVSVQPRRAILKAVQPLKRRSSDRQPLNRRPHPDGLARVLSSY